MNHVTEWLGGVDLRCVERRRLRTGNTRRAAAVGSAERAATGQLLYRSELIS
jgi:hypothetical protein